MARYEDLQQAFGNDVLALWNHYKTLGEQEGRDARDDAAIREEIAAERLALEEAEREEAEQETPEPEKTPGTEETQKPSQGEFVQKGSVIDSGEYKGLDWLVTDAGELVVTGHMEGEGLDAKSIWTEAPWQQYRKDIVTACLNFTGAKSLEGFFYGTKSGVFTYPVLSEVFLSGLDTSSVTHK